MEANNLISLHEFCDFHKIENSFVLSLNEHDFVEIFILNGKPFIHNDSVGGLEKIIRLYKDLQINFEGIDVIIHLLGCIKELQSELLTAKNKIAQFEKEVNLSETLEMQD